MKNEEAIREAVGRLRQALDLLLQEEDPANPTFYLYSAVEVLRWVLEEDGGGWLYPLRKADRVLCEAGAERGAAAAHEPARIRLNGN